MMRDEQFVVILLGAILMAQRAAMVVDAARVAPRNSARAHPTAADGYLRKPTSGGPAAHSFDLLT